MKNCRTLSFISVPYLKDGSKTSKLIIIYSFLIRIALNDDAKTNEKKKELRLVYSTLIGVEWGRRDFIKSVFIRKSKGIFRVQKNKVERISV